MSIGNWDRLFFCSCAVTLAKENEYGLVEDAAIAVKDGRIVWIGKKNSLSRNPNHLAKDVCDLDHTWITPGLIDCHTHLIFAGNRSHEFELRLKGVSYAEIAKRGGGILSTVFDTRRASSEELLTQGIKRLKQLQREGVTTVEIKSGYGLDLTTELKMLSVAHELQNQCPVTVFPTFLGAHARSPEYSSNDDYIDYICFEVLPAVAHQSLAQAVDVFCENIGFSIPQTEKVFQAAKQFGLAIKCHAEQLSHFAASSLAARYRALSVDHVEYISEEDIRAISNSETVAVILPGAFYQLQHLPHPPIADFRRYNVPMAIATDCNPGTSPTCSLLLMMNMACVLFGLTPAEALAGVTRHAAKALGLQKERGTLEVGKVADFAIWDIKHPAELSYYAGYNPCVGFVKEGVVYLLK